MKRQTGFTLIELVAVIVILAVAAVPLFGLFTQASASLLDNEAMTSQAVILIWENCPD